MSIVLFIVDLTRNLIQNLTYTLKFLIRDKYLWRFEKKLNKFQNFKCINANQKIKIFKIFSK